MYVNVNVMVIRISLGCSFKQLCQFLFSLNFKTQKKSSILKATLFFLDIHGVCFWKVCSLYFFHCNSGTKTKQKVYATVMLYDESKVLK